ncbi:MAG: S8 family serine peptidase, partial [Bacteroidaceae bacterium]|nr:S8 family serine peptidase [Bacteroidaceae bacterium]
MKKLILSFVALALSATAFSQAQVDLNLSLKMKEVTSVKKTYAKSPLLKERICVAADVQEWAIPEINRFAKVQAYSGGIALIDLNVSDLEQLCNTKGVKFVNSPGTAHLCMDKAREKGNIDRVHKGEDLPQGYDGTGVTVGIVDAGIDPNHAAFTDAQGNSRVKSFLVYDSIKGEYCPATTPEEIKKIKTDLPTTFHGTHTSSIAAGRELGNGYGGVAPGADIIMGAANADPNPKYEKLTTADRVLLTLALTTEYAKIYDTPRVFNLSAGYNLGAHDGTDLYSRFVGGLAKDNIICISAGNEGMSDVAANHTFKQNENAYLLMPFGSNNVQLWSDTDKPFKGEVSLVNNYTGEIVKFFSVDDVSEVKVIDNNDTSEAGKYLKWLVSPKEALLAVSSSVRAQNNRYCLELVYNIPEIEDTQLHYRILVKVSGEEGQKVSAYEENSSLKFEDVKN